MLPLQPPCPPGLLFDDDWFGLVASGEIDPETVNPQHLAEARFDWNDERA